MLNNVIKFILTANTGEVYNYFYAKIDIEFLRKTTLGVFLFLRVYFNN